MKMLPLLSALVFAQAFIPAHSSEANLRTVSTEGTYEVQTAPDEAILTVGVKTTDANLPIAMTQNNDRTRAILALAKKYGIPSEDVRTSRIAVCPRYKESKPSIDGFRQDRSQITGYMAYSGITFDLKDLSKLEPLMTDLAQSGITSIDQTTFTSTKLPALRQEARKLAARSAHDKAEMLAAELGAKLGKIRTIRDELASRFMEGPALQGAVNGTIGPQGEFISSEDIRSIAPGKITVESRVDATFDLE
jgi:uncharacterized protein YggE